MNLQQIVNIVISIASFLLATLIPSVILLIRNYKKLRAAKNQAEEEKALNELQGIAQNLIVEAEKTYKEVDVIMKSQGGAGAGKVKKDSVMSKMQNECNAKHIVFDQAYWDAKIDEIVLMTRQVNAR